MFYSEIYQPGVADFDHGGKFGYEAILRIFENTASRHSTARATTSLRKAATASPGC